MKKTIFLIDKLLLFLLVLNASVICAQSDTVYITDADLGISPFQIWTNNKIYVLDGPVTLEKGTLFILPGTTIIAKSVPSEERHKTSNLTVLPGASLLASGNETEPILFTTDELYPDPNSEYLGWGGISVFGGGATGTTAIRYVKIAFAGKGNGNEIGSALFLKDVESSIIDFIEVFGSKGDGIRIHGGNADIVHAAVSHVMDDAFEWDYGWIGRGLYWFSVKNGLITDSYGTNSHSFAIEGKGNIGSNQRISNPEIFNATLIGESCLRFPSNSQYEGGISLIDNTAGLIANSVIIDFSDGGIRVEDLVGTMDCRQQLEDGALVVANNVWWNINSASLKISQSNNQGTSALDLLRQVVRVEFDYEDPSAASLLNHLTQNQNIYRGPGIAFKRADGDCLALDPRLHPDDSYHDCPQRSYPDADFYQRRGVVQGEQKGAFEKKSLWLTGWSELENYMSLGEDAQPSYYLFGRQLQPGDTISINCKEINFLLDQIDIEGPCIWDYDLTSAVTRRGNVRRRPKNSKEGGIGQKIILTEEWDILNLDSECQLPDTLNLTFLVYDNDPPVIYPIPDDNGGITAFTEDCRASEIIAIEIDTTWSFSRSYIRYSFLAEDEFGNQSSLTIQRVLGPNMKACYADLDGDGYGNPEMVLYSEVPPAGFVLNGEDCNDNNSAIFPDSNNGTCHSNPGDHCPDAIHLEVVDTLNCLLSFDSIYSPSYEGLLPGNCNLTTGEFQDIWLSFNGPISGTLQLNTFSNELINERGYYFELYEGNCENLTQLDCFGNGQRDFEYFIQGLDPALNYYLRIQDADNLAFGAVAICLREISILGQSEDLDRNAIFQTDSGGNPTYNRTEITVFPNPVGSEYAYFRFDSPKEEQLSVLLYSIGGKPIRKLLSNFFVRAGYVGRIETSSLEPGIYYLQFQTKTISQAEKIIILK